VKPRTALVVGAGGVLGEALCAEFLHAGYGVTGLRRASSGPGHPDVQWMACDLGDADDTRRAAAAALDSRGHIDVAICNAAQLVFAPFAELRYEDFVSCWRVGVGSVLGCACAVLPAMAARGDGALLMSGATASIRGSASFSAFASAKFALRGLAQSLAREYQPAGVHVAHVVLDGLLRDSKSAARFGTREGFLEPREVAAFYRTLAEQPASAWTHELDLRPRAGRF
jgi:NAD(P)-dependent dehydrogenase (short-subunit alcohol dehydrogenase family)